MPSIGQRSRRRHFSLIVFRRDGSEEKNDALIERVNRSGEIFMSSTRLDGRYILRLAVRNNRTTERDVRLAWERCCGARRDSEGSRRSRPPSACVTS